LLLEHKAALEVEDSNKQRPLHCAARGGLGSCIQLLLNSKADVTAKDMNGKTAAQLASNADAVAMLRQAT